MKFRMHVPLFALFFLLNLSQNSFAKSPLQMKPVFVLVHGAWGGSWAFRRVDSLLTEKGFKVYRPSLTGLGERVHLASSDITLRTHITDVVNMILFENIHEVILVGHSYGGMVVTGVADSIPDRIKKIIYVDAFLPSDGECVFSIWGQKSDWLKTNIKEDYIIPFWVKPDQKLPKDVPHPLKTFSEPIKLSNESAKVTPGIYLLTVEPGHKAEDDDFASQSERARQKGWPVYKLNSDHNPQWSAPEDLVNMLIENK